MRRISARDTKRGAALTGEQLWRSARVQVHRRTPARAVRALAHERVAAHEKAERKCRELLLPLGWQCRGPHVAAYGQRTARLRARAVHARGALLQGHHKCAAPALVAEAVPASHRTQRARRFGRLEADAAHCRWRLRQDFGIGRARCYRYGCYRRLRGPHRPRLRRLRAAAAAALPPRDDCLDNVPSRAQKQQQCICRARRGAARHLRLLPHALNGRAHQGAQILGPQQPRPPFDPSIASPIGAAAVDARDQRSKEHCSRLMDLALDAQATCTRWPSELRRKGRLHVPPRRTAQPAIEGSHCPPGARRRRHGKQSLRRQPLHQSGAQGGRRRRGGWCVERDAAQGPKTLEAHAHLGGTATGAPTCGRGGRGDRVVIRRGQQPTRQGVENRGCSIVQQVARELRAATLAAAGPLRDAARGAAKRRGERHG